MKYCLALYLVLVFFGSCSPNNVTVDDSLAPYFKEAGVQGTFALLDNASNKFTVYNLSRYRDSAYAPASTFKIVNGLIGLQTGIVSSDTMMIPWDGVQRSFPEWNKDLRFTEAFRLSAVPYFQEVARRIGRDTMQHWLDTLSYGSKKITSRIDTFWLDGSLTIRPDEQMGLVKRLYFGQLPFHKINQDIIKKAMVFEDVPAYKLSYKTGWRFWNSSYQKHLGWMIGWIEENEQVSFFVLNIETGKKDFDMAPVRLKLLKDILAHLGRMQTKKAA